MSSAHEQSLLSIFASGMRSQNFGNRNRRLWWPSVFLALATVLAGTAHAGGIAAQSRDPYIRMHAEDFVDWQVWGPAAFRQATRENKPIFLSVGFLSCLYCHVEEQEVFRNADIAAFMNKHFVNVMVDRERRPQVDRIYQIAQRQMKQQVAWPNSLVLTPQRVPFAGGGYFPLTSHDPQRMGFRQMIEQAEMQWRQHPKQAKARSRQILQLMQQQVRGDAGGGQVAPGQWLDDSLSYWNDLYDRQYGGFGEGDSRFPNAPVLSMLLSVVIGAGDGTSITQAGKELRHSLDAMASGTLMDQVNGGFRRYSTDPQWNHPHREKMLYSNALLLSVYARAARRFDDPYYRLVAQRTGQFLTQRFLTAKGGFYTSISPRIFGADVGHPKLSKKLITQALGSEQAGRFLKLYAFVPISIPTNDELFAGEVPGFLRLRVADSVYAGQVTASDLVDRIKATDAALTKLRARLATPSNTMVVRTRIAATNGLAITALAQAGVELDHKQWVDAATSAAQWLWSHLYVENGAKKRQLWHQLSLGAVQGEGTLEDYANVGIAFMAVYQATRDKIWRHRAERIARQLRTTFQRKNGLLVSVADARYLILEPVSLRDGQTPSATTQAIRLFHMIYQATGQRSYQTAANAALRAAAGRVSSAPGQWPALVTVAQTLDPAARPRK